MRAVMVCLAMFFVTLFSFYSYLRGVDNSLQFTKRKSGLSIRVGDSYKEMKLRSIDADCGLPDEIMQWSVVPSVKNYSKINCATYFLSEQKALLVFYDIDKDVVSQLMLIKDVDKPKSERKYINLNVFTLRCEMVKRGFTR